MRAQLATLSAKTTSRLPYHRTLGHAPSLRWHTAFATNFRIGGGSMLNLLITRDTIGAPSQNISKGVSTRCAQMPKETRNLPPPRLFLASGLLGRSASSLEKMRLHFLASYHRIMSRQSFSGFAAVDYLSPCTSRNGDACEHIGTLAPFGKKLIRIRSPHGVLVTSASTRSP